MCHGKLASFHMPKSYKVAPEVEKGVNSLWSN